MGSVDQSGMKSERAPLCAICGASGEPLYENLTDAVFAATGTWSMSRCSRQECGLLWLDPMPHSLDLADAYREYYTHADLAMTARRKLGKFLYRGLVNAFLFFVSVPGESARAARMFIDWKTPGRLLDVGCGRGDFLNTMAKCGWVVRGVDSDPVAAMAAKSLYGLDVCVGSLDDVVALEDHYDVVTASHVLEHVPDPKKFLAQCRRLLNRGGKLVLKTPNVKSYGHARYGENWRGLEPPRHLHLFTINALNACATHAGFTNVQIFTTTVASEQILIASHYIRHKGAFRPETQGLLDSVMSRALAPLLAMKAKVQWLANPESGEEICAILTADRHPTGE